jgi:hypothetical protein
MMRRSEIVGLCVVVASVLSVILTSEAQASAPEYFACAKVAPKNTGKYSDKECASYVGSGGRYERVSAIGATFKAKFKTTEFATRGLGPSATVTCKKGSAVGKINSSNRGADESTYEDCSMDGSACKSTGQTSGTIATGPLGTLLEGSELQPRIVLTTGSDYPYQFECGGTLFRYNGYAGATFTAPAAGHASKKATEVFSGSAGNLYREESTTDGETWVGNYESEEVVTVDSVSSEPVGID